MINFTNPIAEILLKSTSGFYANGGVGYDLSLANIGDLSLGLTTLLNVNYQSLYGRMTTNNLTMYQSLSTLKLGLSLEPYVSYKVVPGVKLSLGAILQPSCRILANSSSKFVAEFLGVTTTLETNSSFLTNDNNISLSVAPVIGASFDISEGIALTVRLVYDIELMKLISEGASKILFNDPSAVSASVNSIFGDVSFDIKLF